jgi:hypothetical protein
MLLDDKGQGLDIYSIDRSGIFAEESRGVVLACTHRPMPHHARRIRRGRKDSRESPIPKVYDDT